MFHWDQIIILAGAALWSCVFLGLALLRGRWGVAKLLLASMALGFGSEFVVFSLKPPGSLAWSPWLFIHLPASLALDPLNLSFRTWKWVTIGLYSLIATGFWFFCLERLQKKSRLLKNN
jgi:hypothetical protein